MRQYGGEHAMWMVAETEIPAMEKTTRSKDGGRNGGRPCYVVPMREGTTSGNDKRMHVCYAATLRLREFPPLS